MKAQAIDRYPVPGYPTQGEVLQNHRLIARVIPTPFRRLLETGVSGAIALLVPLSGCDRNPAGAVAAPSSQQVEGLDPNDTQTAVQPKTAQKVLLLSPIFPHGEGRGSIGCVVVAAPVFLTEEEGLSVIKEELSKSGIRLENKSVGYDTLRMYVETDLVSESEPIVIEFVSEDDYRDMGGGFSLSTVMSYDFLKVAQDFRTRLAAKVDHGVFGIFYDPVVSMDWSKANLKYPKWREKIDQLQYKISTPAGRKKLNDRKVQYWRNRWKQLQKETQNEAKELLRQQVRDFAQWLADQKMIDGKTAGAVK